MTWDDLSNRIDNEIKEGFEIPKTDGGTRRVTRKMGSHIYMKTGVKTNAEKYITKDMLNHAFNIINSGKIFTSKSLQLAFPREYAQGSCVFSMTGGILEKLGIAKYLRRKGYISIINKI